MVETMEPEMTSMDYVIDRRLKYLDNLVGFTKYIKRKSALEK